MLSRSQSSIRRNFIFILCGVIFVAFLAAAAQAQQAGGWIAITGVDAQSAPTIALQIYGMNESGTPLSFDPAEIEVLHDGQVITNVVSGESVTAGTFTLFLIDAPPGVEQLLPEIQQSIEQFGSPPYLQEGVDYMAIYRVGPVEAEQILEPTTYYNAIRNFFADPLQPQSGPTALVDSLGSLLSEVANLDPVGTRQASIVVLTDGTDIVSSRFDPEELGNLAASLRVPVHTIWLENSNLQAFSHQAGQDYLAGLAAESRGLSARLGESAEVSAIWTRISSFRDQARVLYTVEDIRGGSHEATLRLSDNPEVAAVASLQIADTLPVITLDLPVDSRTLLLPDLTEPVRVTFSTSHYWLDGTERQVVDARLLVNEVLELSIDPDRLDRFSAELSGLNYGTNNIQIVITDNLEQEARTAPIELTVEAGEDLELPEALQPSGLQDSVLLRLGLLLVGLFLLTAFAALFLYRGRLAALFDRRTRVQRAGTAKDVFRRSTPEIAVPRPAPGASASIDEEDYRSLSDTSRQRSYSMPALEIVDSVTRMPERVELTSVEHHIGRSPVHADIVFENDITVSRLHASIVKEGKDYRIYDEGSDSGTWVNGQKVPEYGHQLADGDQIFLGAVVMHYRR